MLLLLLVEGDISKPSGKLGFLAMSMFAGEEGEIDDLHRSARVYFFK